jgi:hypothetical protein
VQRQGARACDGAGEVIEEFEDDRIAGEVWSVE